jgi:hypothetical protein
VPAWQQPPAPARDLETALSAAAAAAGPAPVVWQRRPTPAAQAAGVIQHALRPGAELARARISRAGGRVNAGLAYQPPSVIQQQAYAADRAWVKPGHEGGLFDRAGTRYQRRHGIPMVALGNFISGAHSRPWAALRLWLALTAAATGAGCLLFPREWLWIILATAGAWVTELLSLFI